MESDGTMRASASGWPSAGADSDQLDASEALLDIAPHADVLDAGYTPPYVEPPMGTLDHESLDERLAEEEPEVWDIRFTPGDGASTDSAEEWALHVVNQGEAGMVDAIGAVGGDDQLDDTGSGAQMGMTSEWPDGG